MYKSNVMYTHFILPVSKCFFNSHLISLSMSTNVCQLADVWKIHLSGVKFRQLANNWKETIPAICQVCEYQKNLIISGKWWAPD